MSSPALAFNVNQHPQGLSPEQLEQLTTITSLAKGSGFLEGKKGGEGFMGSFVDSATGQKHYVKMLTHGYEQKDALGNNAQEANLLSGSERLGEMSNSMKDDLLELARAVGVDDKVQKLFDSSKKKDCFKDLVSRKIALEAAKLIGDAHNDKSGVKGVRFDWKAVAREEKSGDTTLGNVLLMKERKQLEGIEKEIGKCNEELKSARANKKEIIKWIDDHEKKIKGCEEALESAYAKKKNFVNGIDFLSTKNYDAIKGIMACDKEIKDCMDALKSAKSGVKEEEYQKMKDAIGKVNSDIDRCVRRRDELINDSIDLKSGIEKVESGLSDVDTLARKMEETKLSNIMNKANVTREEMKFFLDSLSKGIVPSKLRKVAVLNSSRIPMGLKNAHGMEILNLYKELRGKCVSDHLRGQLRHLYSQSGYDGFNLRDCDLVGLWNKASKVAEDVLANLETLPNNAKELMTEFGKRWDAWGKSRRIDWNMKKEDVQVEKGPSQKNLFESRAVNLAFKDDDIQALNESSRNKKEESVRLKNETMQRMVEEVASEEDLSVLNNVNKEKILSQTEEVLTLIDDLANELAVNVSDRMRYSKEEEELKEQIANINTKIKNNTAVISRTDVEVKQLSSEIKDIEHYGGEDEAARMEKDFLVKRKIKLKDLTAENEGMAKQLSKLGRSLKDVENNLSDFKELDRDVEIVSKVRTKLFGFKDTLEKKEWDNVKQSPIIAKIGVLASYNGTTEVLKHLRENPDMF